MYIYIIYTYIYILVISFLNTFCCESYIYIFSALTASLYFEYTFPVHLKAVNYYIILLTHFRVFGFQK